MPFEPEYRFIDTNLAFEGSYMKRLTRSAAPVLVLSFLFVACGLKDPIPAATGCTQMTAAIQGKCPAPVVDCNAFVACKAASEWEKVDTDTCVANIKAAADCDAALKVTCAIACVEK